MFTKEQINEILAVCEKATPGPWKVVEGKSFGVQSENRNIASCFRTENEQFIALARTVLPQLAQRVMELEGKVDPYWMNKAQELEAENAKLQATIAATQDALEEIKARCELRRQDDDAHYENYYEAKKALAAAGYGGEE